MKGQYYGLRTRDFIPGKGFNEYLTRNSRYDLAGKAIPRAKLLLVYNVLVGLTGVVTMGVVLEGLEKILK